jgi:hypothetical protein
VYLWHTGHLGTCAVVLRAVYTFFRWKLEGRLPLFR